jgi:CheY-like chemotaxis protein
MKLLIVEDNESMRSTIKSIIGESTNEIYECWDGGEAVALYFEHRPDWVLMDIKLERMDGIEATSKIKALFPEAKIVVVTNYDDQKLKKAAFRAGALLYLLKRDLLEINQIFNSYEERSSI